MCSVRTWAINMLEIENIESFYGPIQALFGMTLACEEGKVTTLLGRNGMGKTTTVKSIIGKVDVPRGRIVFQGVEVRGRPTHDIVRRGIGLVPEGRQIFPNLSVRENLVATADNFGSESSLWTLERVLDFFPALAERLERSADPGPFRASRQHGQSAFGWRAADARHRASSDAQPENADS